MLQENRAVEEHRQGASNPTWNFKEVFLEKLAPDLVGWERDRQWNMFQLLWKYVPKQVKSIMKMTDA